MEKNIYTDIKLKIFSQSTENKQIRTVCIELPLSYDDKNDNKNKTIEKQEKQENQENQNNKPKYIYGETKQEIEQINNEYKLKTSEFVKKAVFIKKKISPHIKFTEVIDKFSYCITCSKNKIFIIGFIDSELVFKLGIKENIIKTKVLLDGNVLILTNSKLYIINLLNNKLYHIENPKNINENGIYSFRDNENITEIDSNSPIIEQIDQIISIESPREIYVQSHIKKSFDFILLNSNYESAENNENDGNEEIDLFEFDDPIIQTNDSNDFNTNNTSDPNLLNDTNDTNFSNTKTNNTSDPSDPNINNTNSPSNSNDTNNSKTNNTSDSSNSSNSNDTNNTKYSYLNDYTCIFYNKDFCIIKFNSKLAFPNCAIHCLKTNKIEYFHINSSYRMFFDAKENQTSFVKSKRQLKKEKRLNSFRENEFKNNDLSKLTKFAENAMNIGNSSNTNEGMSLNNLVNKLSKSQLSTNDIPKDLLNDSCLDLFGKNGTSLNKLQKKKYKTRVVKR